MAEGQFCSDLTMNKTMHFTGFIVLMHTQLKQIASIYMSERSEFTQITDLMSSFTAFLVPRYNQTILGKQLNE